MVTSTDRAPDVNEPSGTNQGDGLELLPLGAPTSVGSLPHRSRDEAVAFVLDRTPALPAAPTLPARGAGDLRAGGSRGGVTAMPPAELVPAWQAGGFDLRITHAPWIRSR